MKEMIEYRLTTEKDTELMMSSRMEMLRVVNDLDDDYTFSDELITESRAYYENGNQTTVLAITGEKVIGCATICYIRMLPTFSHPTGKRAHLMNVYTMKDYRRQGIARKMLSILIDDAWKHGATEISLDATESGRPLYEKLGFIHSEECMILQRRDGHEIQDH